MVKSADDMGIGCGGRAVEGTNAVVAVIVWKCVQVLCIVGHNMMRCNECDSCRQLHKFEFRREGTDDVL